MVANPEALLQRMVEDARRAEEARSDSAARGLASFLAEARRLLPASVRGWLIGSLADGSFGPHSDVDVVIDGLTPDLIVQLEKAAARCCAAPIDLIDWSDLAPELAHKLIANGIALHVA